MAITTTTRMRGVRCGWRRYIFFALLLLIVLSLLVLSSRMVEDYNKHWQHQWYHHHSNSDAAAASILRLLPDFGNYNDFKNETLPLAKSMLPSMGKLPHSATVPSLLSSSSTPETSSAISMNPDATVLRNIRMVLIGDSVMRYQYLSLVYRLRHGVWFDDSQSLHTYHLVREASFANPYHGNTWGEFLFQTNRMLQPYEVCDCYRKPVKRMEDIIENRYYYDPVLNNSVVFLLAYGQYRFPMMGRLSAPNASSSHQTTTPGWQEKAFREFEKTKGCCWIYRNWSKLIREYVQALDPLPRHIVMNAGLWPHRLGAIQTPSFAGNDTTDQASAETLTGDTVELLQLMNETPHLQYTWRTTTCYQNRECSNTESDRVMCAHLHHCVNVSYTKQVRTSLYWDNGHFYEPVYRSINEEMLDQLGYLPHDYRRMNLSDVLE